MRPRVYRHGSHGSGIAAQAMGQSSWQRTGPAHVAQDKTPQSITTPTLPEEVAVKEEQGEFRGEHEFRVSSYSWNQK